MRRLGIISVVLLTVAFVCGFSARQMYLHTRATSRICPCPECTEFYFAEKFSAELPWANAAGSARWRARSRIPSRIEFSLPRDPAGALPITTVAAVSLVCLLAAALCTLAWALGLLHRICDLIVTVLLLVFPSLCEVDVDPPGLN